MAVSTTHVAVKLLVAASPRRGETWARAGECHPTEGPLEALGPLDVGSLYSNFFGHQRMHLAGTTPEL